MYYIFDFDGTLVDSMPYWAGVHINALKENNIPCPENFVETITPLGNLKASEYTISLGIDITLDKYLEKINLELHKQYSELIPLKKGVRETLTKLQESGHSLNILTASPHKFLDVCLKRLGIYDMFDNVWSIDDFGHSKAETVIYLMAAERLGTTPENCVFFDDNYIAIATAKESRMKTIAVYDETAKNQQEKLKLEADTYIYSFEEFSI